jgi:hypothetical protein
MARTKVDKSTGNRAGKAQKRELSLYGLSIEDALRAAAQTGRPPSLEPKKPNQQRKKRAKPE